MYTQSDLKKLGITKLKTIAKDLKIPGYTKYKSENKDELISKIIKKIKDDKRQSSPKKKTNTSKPM